MRFDNQGHILIQGERVRPNGTYEYRFSSPSGRKSLYFKTLKELRHIVYGIVLEDSYDELQDTMMKCKQKWGDAWVW